MNITLYKSSAEPNRLNKTSYLTQVAAYTGAVARQNLSMHSIGQHRDPYSLGYKALLVLEETISHIKEANYCYISDFGRYYYIREKTCDANGLYTLVLNVDVLMSFKSDILTQKGIVSKQEGIYNMYLPSEVPSEVRPLVTTVKMNPTASGAGFTNQSNTFVLLAIGGK